MAHAPKARCICWPRGRWLEGRHVSAGLRARCVPLWSQPGTFLRYELDLIIDLARRNGAARDPLIPSAPGPKADMGLQTLRAHALRANDESTPFRVASVSKYAWSNWHRDLGELAMDVLGEQGRTGAQGIAFSACSSYGWSAVPTPSMQAPTRFR